MKISDRGVARSGDQSRCSLLLDGHMPRQPSPRDLIAVCFGGEIAAIAGDGVNLAGSHDEIIQEVARMETRRHPRWVFWSARPTHARWSCGAFTWTGAGTSPKRIGSWPAVATPTPLSRGPPHAGW